MTDDEHELAVSRIAAVHLTQVWAARRWSDARVTAFAEKYAPILAKLSETEFCGLITALVAEGESRQATLGRDGRAERLFRENVGGKS